MTRDPRDPDQVTKPSNTGKAPGNLATRLLWFAALWLASLAAVSAVALAIRAVLR